MNRNSLRSFLAEQLDEAKESEVLFPPYESHDDEGI